MTENEFKVCSILLIKKYEGKRWGEVFPGCLSFDKNKLVSVNTFENFDKELFFNKSIVAFLSCDGRIIIFKDNIIDFKLNHKEFLEYFKLSSEDMV